MMRSRASPLVWTKGYQYSNKQAYANPLWMWASLGAAGSCLISASYASYYFSDGVDWEAMKADIALLFDPESDDTAAFGPMLVRLAWHASGTYDKATNSGGSNGSTMRFPTEANDGANAGLHRARNLLEAIKKKYPKASYADIWTLAGAVAIERMGGPKISWKGGRVDYTSEEKCPPNGRLPNASLAEDHIRQVFYRMGFNDREIVALIGAHALGRCHTFNSGYDGPWTQAPYMFSNEFYRVLLEEEWKVRRWKGPKQYENKGKDLMMLPSDMALVEDKEFRKYVEMYAEDEDLFFADFAAAFSKLLHLGCP